MRKPHEHQIFSKNYAIFGRIGVTIAGFFHLMFIVIFYVLGIMPLVFVNIVSVFSYLYCLAIIEKSIANSDYRMIGWIIYSELLGHAIAASYFVGLESGFQYYALVLVSMPYLFFHDYKIVGILKNIIIMIVFVSLNIFFDNHQSPYKIEADLSKILRNFNITAFLAISIFVSNYYANMTYNIRNHLTYTSNFDLLSGLYNRRHFIYLAQKELSRIKRDKSSLSLILMDIDHFKKVNDTYGHPCGDCVITQISETIENSLRSEDVIARWGGEEFIILLPNTDSTQVVILAERLRLTIKNQKFVCSEADLKVTVTLGLTTINQHALSLDDLVEKADQALYVGKENGRDQYVIN